MRIGFLGQNDMGGAALRALCDEGVAPVVVVTRPSTSHENAVERYAATDLNLRKIHPDRADDIGAALRTARADVVVCCGWSRVIPARLLDIPPRGWLNMHPSWLPHWRGSNPIGWQIISGATSLGYTVHQMTEVVDAGRPLARGFVDLPADANGKTARELVGTALGRATAAVCRCGAPPREPAVVDAEAWSSCPPPGVLPLLDANVLRCAQAARAVRAFGPYPGVGVTTLPRDLLAVAVGERAGIDESGLARRSVAFVDGALALWCRRA